MQFSAHLDDMDGSKKKIEPKNKPAKAEFSVDQHFDLEVEAGRIVSSKKKEVAPKPVKLTESKDVIPKPQVSAKPFSKEDVKFVLTRVFASVLIFTLGYVIINWSAISELLKFRFGNHEIAEVVENGDLNMLTDQNEKLPILNMSITPPDMRIVIPKISKNVPVVPVPTANLVARDWTALENDIQGALKDGVVHYPGTAYPNQIGNVVITGHSSYFPWDPGRFKDVFALLHGLKLSDEITVYYEQEKFVYQVSEIKVVTPDKVDVLGPTDDSQLTLITCTPIGTNEKRLIVIGKLIEGRLADGTKVKKL